MAGKVVEKIPKILDWVEEQTAHWERLRIERETPELRRKQPGSGPWTYPGKQWVADAIAATAV
jgi:hypothetical protein